MTGFLSAHWAFAFGVLGNIVSFMVFLAPIPTFYRIYKKKTSEGYQCVPYVVAFFSALLWIYYAILKTNTLLLITINAAGLVIETVYIVFFIIYANKASRIQTVKLIALLVVCGTGFVGVVQWVVKPAEQVKVVGWVCLIISLAVFVAPLCIVRHVIKTKSVEHMPFLLSFFLTLSAVMWFFYGLGLKDFNIAIPNVLGFTFGIIQMVLYKMYKNVKKVEEPEKIEIPNQVTILEELEREIPHLAEQIIDIVKLSTVLATPEKVAVISQLNNKLEGVRPAANLPVPARA